MLIDLLARLFSRRSASDTGKRLDLVRRGLAAEGAGRFTEAEQAYRELLERDPADADGLHLLGHLMLRQGRHDEALGTLERSVTAAPRSPQAWYHLGQARRGLARLAPAADAFGRAVSLDPAFAAASVACGDTLMGLDRVDEAEDCYRRAIELEPGSATARHNYGNLLLRLGRIEEALAAYRRAVELDPAMAQTHSNLVYTLNFLPGIEPDDVYAEHLAWAKQHAVPFEAAAAPHANAREPGRRLEIGYLSPNFRDHPVTQFFEPVLRHHDRSRFGIHLYADVGRPDATTARLRGYGDAWCDIAPLDDDAAAARIRADGIDILVDLTGHTDAHRLLVFARRPAPVQVTWNGYANTTGMAAMDYRLTDARADPEGVTDRWHSERLVRLPEIYMAYEPPLGCPAVAPAPADARGYVTFASFNAYVKLNARVIEVWSRLLAALPQSRLLILTVPEGRSRAALVRAFEDHGIPETRLTLRGRLPYEDYLAAHAEADIALDPFPFSGTTTTCNSLWMGVPVITLAGRTHAGRVSASMLAAVGLEGLVARDEREYVDLALALARDTPRLTELRVGLRERMRAAPITNGERLARFVEEAYRGMWASYCR